MMDWARTNAPGRFLRAVQAWTSNLEIEITKERTLEVTKERTGARPSNPVPRPGVAVKVRTAG
jgi:hypothetical protein